VTYTGPVSNEPDPRGDTEENAEARSAVREAREWARKQVHLLEPGGPLGSNTTLCGLETHGLKIASLKVPATCVVCRGMK
jgi:hypothetical protein